MIPDAGMEETIFDDPDYESGPFCRHWGDPCDCDVKCARCGHHCFEHWNQDPCAHRDCTCEGWVEEDS